jgi:peptidoglycan/xylan/chitin deacetylase (PgdA/CDA1 family)
MTKSADEFRRDLAYLRRHYECISLRELCERLRAGVPFRRRAAVITFDDGYRDNYTAAAPALREAGLTATFFVSTGYIGTERIFPHDQARATSSDHPKLTWDDLRMMEAAGFEIGSHTVEHADLGRADEAAIERELCESLATLNRELGERPRAFAFPWGKPENITAQAATAIQNAGYYAALSAYGGANTCGASPFDLRRCDAGNGALNWLALRARLAGLDPDHLRLRLKRLVTMESKKPTSTAYSGNQALIGHNHRLMSRISIRQLKFFFWFLAVALGAIQTWALRDTISPDGVSYLDLGDAYARCDLSG